MTEHRLVLVTWDAIDRIVDDEWDSLSPAMQSAVHSLREYTRAMGSTLRDYAERSEASKSDYAGPKPLTAEDVQELRQVLGEELAKAPKEDPLPAEKGTENGAVSFEGELAERLLNAGYGDGFGVTSLDTLLCEQMARPSRVDFAAFLIREILQGHVSTEDAAERKTDV